MFALLRTTAAGEIGCRLLKTSEKVGGRLEGPHFWLLPFFRMQPRFDFKSVAGLGEEVHDGEEKWRLLCRSGKSVKCWERQRHARVETRS